MTSSRPDTIEFIIGTAASVHICAVRECFTSLYKLRTPTKLASTGPPFRVYYKGDIALPVVSGGEVTWLYVNDVFYAPDLSCNILSAMSLCAEMKPSEGGYALYDESGNKIAQAVIRGRLLIDVDVKSLERNAPPPTLWSKPMNQIATGVLTEASSE